MNELNKDRIDETRRRLYRRGQGFSAVERTTLSDTKIDVARNWQRPKIEKANVTDLRSGLEVPVATEQAPPAVEEAPVPEKPKRRRYRAFILLGSFFIFVIVAVISSLYLYYGGNQISSENIGIAIDAPFSVGGGELLPLQISVANQNSVPIESATLIIKYPPGTLSTDDPPKSLFEERIQLQDLAAGEVRNVSTRAILFGEENSRQEIFATLEYRPDGSNSFFYKETEPTEVLIGSTPLVLRVDSIEKVASGQTFDVTLTAVSNASSPLYNVLVSAEYPNGFIFDSATPEPIFGQDVWRIAEILPEQQIPIKIRGTASGLTEETFRINFSAGTADPSNQYMVGSILAEAGLDFLIERPFIDLDVRINGQPDDKAVIPEGSSSGVFIQLTNTLDETVYDMVIEAFIEGNVLYDKSIDGGDGFYDSNTGRIHWETSNKGNLAQVLPGEGRSIRFGVKPNDQRTTATYNVSVKVYAKRVAETSAQEQLLGSAVASAKYHSIAFLGSQAGHNNGLFTDTGPIPPKVGETTTYTLTIVAEAGSNDIVDTVVNSSLPIYVNWLDNYQGEGTVTYNPISKQLQWDVGTIEAGNRKELSFQVSMKPSSSQVAGIPTLLNAQTMRSKDRFTNTDLQNTAAAVTTNLSTELGFAPNNGRVVEE